MTRDLAAITDYNFAQFRNSVYLGRGFVVGIDKSGKYLVQIYFMTGRRPSSRDRLFDQKDGRIFTKPIDPSKPVENPELIFYDAMVEHEFNYGWAVSNGRQTKDALDVVHGYTLTDALESVNWKYEPDQLSTPRITAVAHTSEEDAPRITVEMSILRKSPWGEECYPAYWKYSGIESGFGYCLTTYEWGEESAQTYEGEPVLLPLAGSQEEILRQYWNSVNGMNRVAMAVKFVDLATRQSETLIQNEFQEIVPVSE